MKQSLGLIFNLLFPLLVFSQSFFTVNVGTFVDAKSPQFDDIRPLGFVYAFQMDGGLSQVYLGGYDKKADATKIVTSIQQKGYRSAYIEERALAQGQTVTVIQLATRETDKLIEWEKFETAGPLLGILKGNQIKIVTGIYSDVEAAKQALPRFRNGGFKDAFVKNVNNTLLIRINQFETGLKKALIPINLEQASAETGTTARPGDYNNTGTSRIIVPKGNATTRPPVVREPGPVTTNLPRTRAGSTAVPNIRPRVKRRSVLDLQTVLKSEKTYNSGLDGYYGPGTKNGYELFKQNNRTFQKYLLLAEFFDPASPSGSNSKIQQAINNLLDDPSAPLAVENSSLPLAKAYKAYLLFRTVGPGIDVNTLMNEAIREAYSGKRLKTQPPFDYNATYSYLELDQLILHLHYLHAAPANDVAAPCWLYEEHPKETASAHASFARYSSESFKLQACDQFLNWEEIRALEAVAGDLNADATLNQAKVATYASARSQLFLAPRALDAEERKVIEQWNTQLWSGLNGWASRDPLHQKITTALKVAYFQSQVRLEDYYMDKGFSMADAKGLALATLKTIVGYPLERFV